MDIVSTQDSSVSIGENGVGLFLCEAGHFGQASDNGGLNGGVVSVVSRLKDR